MTESPPLSPVPSGGVQVLHPWWAQALPNGSLHHFVMWWFNTWLGMPGMDLPPRRVAHVASSCASIFPLLCMHTSIVASFHHYYGFRSQTQGSVAPVLEICDNNQLLGFYPAATAFM